MSWLHNGNKSFILNYIKRKYCTNKDKDRLFKRNHYYFRFLLQNEVICYRCGEVIPDDSEYSTVGAGCNKNLTKYYHENCYRTIFHYPLLYEG